VVEGNIWEFYVGSGI